jgi:hypothetical protein
MISASQALADFTQEQWQHYVSQFVPIENSLIEWAVDPNKVTQNRDRAMTGFNQQFDIAQQGLERRQRSYGITLNADEQRASDRNADLQRSLGEVQVANTSRDLTIDRQRGIMGAAPAMPQG